MIIQFSSDIRRINLSNLDSIPLSERRTLPNYSAIYFLMNGDECLYVGQSGKNQGGLVLRWLNHELLPLSKQYPDLRIALFVGRKDPNGIILDDQQTDWREGSPTFSRRIPNPDYLTLEALIEDR